MPALAGRVFGFRNGVPNNADKDSQTSSDIARALYTRLGVVRRCGPREAPGTMLEAEVAEYLGGELSRLDSSRRWDVKRGTTITAFEQYGHLKRLNDVVVSNPTLRTEIGTDYLIKPDVTVGLTVASARKPVLHAAVSCKWTIRSDRVQNIRHEGVILTRSRRGRQPHIVTVTAEPLPSRLASIARGTGEVDIVFHVALSELVESVRAVGNADQLAHLEELIGQRRLADLSALPAMLAEY